MRREMMTVAGRAILALVPDLMFSVHLREAAARMDDSVAVVDTAADFRERLQEMRPTLAIVDLMAAGGDVEELVTASHAVGCRLIGFGPHAQRELLKQAESAGCDAVYPNSRFKMQTGEILQEWANA